ncbi:MAG: right-handed parallel beta-helix repeat-containing protein [Candidatus Hydrogenedentes bacterium]|nr:right-handed parallel beta-helix repeat-containing protein [Candidatus Hydrogenedentota bacterium]
MPTFLIRNAGALACALGSLLAAASGATEYHVARNGSDQAAGTVEAPFQSLGHAATVLQPGDACVVRAGVYRETFRPAHSGTPEQPIVIRAFEGERVTISGADEVTGWIVGEGGRISVPLDAPVRQVFANGAMLHEARWPNIAPGSVWPEWAEAGEGSDAQGINASGLPAMDLSGATIHVLPGSQWVTWTRPVTGIDADAANAKIRFDGSWPQEDAYRIQPGTRYALFGAASLLDAPGEWHYDAATLQLAVLPPTGAAPDATLFEVKRRDLAIDLRGRSHVIVEGLQIVAATVHLGDATQCVVRNCHLRYPTHLTAADGWVIPESGLVLGGTANRVCDSSIQYSAGNGVGLSGTDNTIENCLIRYVNYLASDCGAIFAGGTGHVITHNTLSDGGRSILLHRTLKAGRITHNDIFNAGLLTTDLGSTYCFATDGAGTEIAWNWVHDNQARHVGVGIYIDNDSRNFIIHHNVSWNNPDSGIRLNTPSHNNLVANNTVFNNGNSLSYWGADNNRDQAGCRVVNNIFTDKVETGDGIVLENNLAVEGAESLGLRPEHLELDASSPCIDAGVPVDGVTGEITGQAPDQGAYEFGAAPWKPGHTWGEP